MTGDHIMRIVNLLQKTRVLRKIADGRNLNVSESSLSDGSNISDSNHFLAATWILHRSYIRLLHQRSLHVGDIHVGERMLQRILRISMAYLCLVLDQFSHEPESSQVNLPAFADINYFYRQLLRAVEGIAAGVSFETRPGHYFPEGSSECLRERSGLKISPLSQINPGN